MVTRARHKRHRLQLLSSAASHGSVHADGALQSAEDGLASCQVLRVVVEGFSALARVLQRTAHDALEALTDAVACARGGVNGLGVRHHARHSSAKVKRREPGRIIESMSRRGRERERVWERQKGTPQERRAHLSQQGSLTSGRSRRCVG